MHLLLSYSRYCIQCMHIDVIIYMQQLHQYTYNTHNNFISYVCASNFLHTYYNYSSFIQLSFCSHTFDNNRFHELRRISTFWFRKQGEKYFTRFDELCQSSVRFIFGCFALLCSFFLLCLSSISPLLRLHLDQRKGCINYELFGSE